jgi:hypothetical protein
VTKGDYRRALALAEQVGREIGAAAVDGDENIAKVSIVGLGMKDHAGVATRMFQVLGQHGINIQLISTSEIKVSVVIERRQTEQAVRVLHAASSAAPPAARGDLKPGPPGALDGGRQGARKAQRAAGERSTQARRAARATRRCSSGCARRRALPGAERGARSRASVELSCEQRPRAAGRGPARAARRRSTRTGRTRQR